MTFPLNYISNARQKKADSSSDFPTVILIHGNSSNSEVWKEQLESDLLSQIPILALDLPGHGASLRNEAYSVHELVETLKTTIKPFEKVVLVGHSLGGHLAVEVLPHLRNCIGLFIFGTPPVNYPLNLGEAFLPDERMALLFKGKLNLEESKRFAECLCENLQEQAFDVLDAIQKTDPSFRDAIGASVARGELADEAEILRTITIPVAILQGAGDALVNLEYIERLDIPYLWRKKVYIIENSTHSPHLENPDSFNRLLLEFLKDTE